jgi:hypothetical protein
MAQTRYYSSAARKTILVDPVDATSTTLIVTGVVGYPATFPFTLILDRDNIDEEVVEVIGSSGDTFTVLRGIDGTNAVAHAAGATVEHGVSARDYREADQHRSSKEHVHGIELGSEVVGTTDTQTLYNKTLESPTLNNPILSGEIIGEVEFDFVPTRPGTVVQPNEGLTAWREGISITVSDSAPPAGQGQEGDLWFVTGPGAGEVTTADVGLTHPVGKQYRVGAHTASTQEDANMVFVAEIDRRVGGDGVREMVYLTQQEYDAITPDPNTVYVIDDEEN